MSLKDLTIVEIGNEHCYAFNRTGNTRYDRDNHYCAVKLMMFEKIAIFRSFEKSTSVSKRLRALQAFRSGTCFINITNHIRVLSSTCQIFNAQCLKYRINDMIEGMDQHFLGYGFQSKICSMRGLAVSQLEKETTLDQSYTMISLNRSVLQHLSTNGEDIKKIINHEIAHRHADIRQIIMDAMPGLCIYSVARYIDWL